MISTAATATSHSSAGTSGPFRTSLYVYEPSGASAGTSSEAEANGFFGSRASRKGLLFEVNENGFCVVIGLPSLPSRPLAVADVVDHRGEPKREPLLVSPS